MKPQSITFEEAKKKYKIGNYLQGKFNGKVLVYNTSVTHTGNFDFLKLLDKDTPGIFVKGNLTVHGTIFDNIDSGFLIVTGDVTTDNIIAGNSEIYLLGDVHVKNTLYGFYNDGSLNMHGKVSAKVIINNNHVIDSKSPMKGITISAFKKGDIPNSDFNPEDLSSVLIAHVLDPEGGIDTGMLVRHILINKPIVKKGAKPSNKPEVKKPNPPTRKPVSSKTSAKIQSSNIPETATINDPHWLTVHAMVKESATLMNKWKFQEAIQKSEEAIKLCKPGKKFSEYDLLYAHYTKMYSYFEIIFREKNKSKRALLIDKANAEAKACLHLVPSEISIWHFTDEGQFQKEVVRQATNGLAWYIYESAKKDDGKKLTQALEYIERGITCYTNPNDNFLFNTKVRILLKLKRANEAYAVVARILTDDPAFADFQDIQKSTAYIKWEMKQETEQ